MMSQGNVLVLTVGTGNREALEESLLKPLEKSIDEGEWCEVFLLPSRVTEGFAARLAERFPDLSVRIEPLPEPDMENDVDACYGHFDAVLGKLLKDYEATSVTVDFTRGTKAMSAALVLAAVRRDIPQLRYVWGERDERGMVVPDTERIGEFATERVTARRRIDAAKGLMGHGNFAAALDLLPDSSGQSGKLLPEVLHDATVLRRQAAFYAAWDRLDYAEADRLASEARLEADLSDAVSWVRRLAQAPEPKGHASMARWLRAIACDLLQNGRRRIRDRHFEDALLRAYRVLELVGQFRLFDHGIDSASVDPDLESVRGLRETLKKKGSQDFGTGRDARLTASRELAARLLKCLGDPLGAELLKFDEKHGGIDAKKRNHSILIHGFEAEAKSHSKSSLDNLYDALDKLLRKAEPRADDMIKTARLCSYDG